jgi:hypothetical protein
MKKPASFTWRARVFLASAVYAFSVLPEQDLAHRGY